MARIPRKSLSTPRGRIPGQEDRRARIQGANNRFTMDFAQVLMLAAHQVGEDNHGRNGLVGYLCRIARTEPKLFFRLS
jgi:hypothetical protein